MNRPTRVEIYSKKEIAVWHSRLTVRAGQQWCRIDGDTREYVVVILQVILPLLGCPSAGERRFFSKEELEKDLQVCYKEICEPNCAFPPVPVLDTIPISRDYNEFLKCYRKIRHSSGYGSD